jgi:integrase
LARQRHRPAVETVLAERGIEVDAAGMATLIRLAAEAVEQADERLLRAAQGDYSPDPREARFPPIGAPQAAIVSPSVLFEPAWEAYLAERKPAAGTAKSYRGAMRNLLAFVGTDDIARVTEEDVRRWKAHPIERGLDPKTIKESKLAAVKSFYGWAVHEKRVEVNPATDVRMKVPKKPKLREREFNEREQKLILSATFAEPSRLISPEHAAVRRWVPWLCAYGGGRVNEMTQLRGQDIYEEDGVWVMRITPEAGTVKTRVARIVPLHPHLIDQGFLTFVRSRGKGPLFYSPERQRGGSAENPTYVRMGQKLAKWVRGLGVDDPNVDPNHGWRHLFKTRGRAAGIASDKLDALQGHAAGSVGAEYGSYPARVLMQEIVKLPRFDVTPAPSTDRRRREVRSVVQTPSQETS